MNTVTFSSDLYMKYALLDPGVTVRLTVALSSLFHSRGCFGVGLHTDWHSCPLSSRFWGVGANQGWWGSGRRCPMLRQCTQTGEKKEKGGKPERLTCHHPIIIEPFFIQPRNQEISQVWVTWAHIWLALMVMTVSSSAPSLWWWRSFLFRSPAPCPSSLSYSYWSFKKAQKIKEENWLSSL